jgi:hypothetical protein
VKRWFDAEGRPALGDLANHFPAHDDWIRGNLKWGEPSVQQVLDTVFAFAVMNNHFEIAGFLLAHGADINTNWSSHEPASWIRDYRWGATAVGWAAVAAKDERLAQWMRDAQQRREQASH